MAADVFGVMSVAGALALVGLGVVLFALRPRSPATVAFAMFLVVLGAFLLYPLERLWPVTGGYWIRVSRWFNLVDEAFLVAFAGVYVLEARGRSTTPAFLGLAAAVAVLWGAYALSPSLAADGWLVVEQDLTWSLYPVAGWVVAREGIRARRGGDVVVGLAIVLFTAVYTTADLVWLATDGWTGARPTQLADPFLRAAGCALFAGWLALASRDETARRFARPALLALGAAALLGALIRVDALARLVYFVTDAAFPAVIAYALVRHRLFGIEPTIRWTIRRGAVAAAFLAVFFVAVQLAEGYVSDEYGWAVGGVAAGLLLFAIAPIQRAAERLAQAVAPDAAHAGRSAPDMYRRHVTVAWADGAITARERRLLDLARDHLGLTRDDAARIEEAHLDSRKRT